jgi:hypothetical protein
METRVPKSSHGLAQAPEEASAYQVAPPVALRAPVPVPVGLVVALEGGAVVVGAVVVGAGCVVVVVVVGCGAVVVVSWAVEAAAAVVGAPAGALVDGTAGGAAVVGTPKRTSCQPGWEASTAACTCAALGAGEPGLRVPVAGAPLRFCAGPA